MKKSKMIIKYATKKHAKEFYGEDWTQSFKGIVALINGKPIGMGGIRFDGEKGILFSDTTSEGRKHKKQTVKCIRVLKKMVEETNYPVCAIASKDEPLSEKILVKLGFKFSGGIVSGEKMFWRVP